MTILKYPLYHILTAIYYPILVISKNKIVFELSDTYRIAVLSIVIAVGIFAFFHWFFRNAHKAAFLSFIGFICLYSYPMVAILPPAKINPTATILLQVSLFLTVVIFTYNAKSIGPNLSKILNGFAVALIFLPTLEIIKQKIDKPTKNWTTPSITNDIKIPTISRPNIVHIVLDGYSRSDVLEKLYGYDNSVFEKSLEDLGFIIAEEAIAPYSETIFSLNAIFAMDYLDDLISEYPMDITAEEFRGMLEYNLQRPMVIKKFMTMGYEVIVIESIFPGVLPTRLKYVISESEKFFQLSYFEKEVLKNTPISLLIDRFLIEDDTYEKVKFQLGKHDFSKFNSPYFVYNHILAPHPPFNITSEGSVRLDPFGIRDGVHREIDGSRDYSKYRIGYIEKLKFANQAILDQIRYLQQHIPDPKIFIIHSDHGGGLYLDQESRTNTCLKERFSAFLTIYSSGVDLSDAITSNMNLVNLYRMILSQIFGEHYPPLPGRGYFVPWSNPSGREAVDEMDLNTYGMTCSNPRRSAGATLVHSDDEFFLIKK